MCIYIFYFRQYCTDTIRNSWCYFLYVYLSSVENPLSINPNYILISIRDTSPRGIRPCGFFFYLYCCDTLACRITRTILPATGHDIGFAKESGGTRGISGEIWIYYWIINFRCLGEKSGKSVTGESSVLVRIHKIRSMNSQFISRK